MPRNVGIRVSPRATGLYLQRVVTSGTYADKVDCPRCRALVVDLATPHATLGVGHLGHRSQPIGKLLFLVLGAACRVAHVHDGDEPSAAAAHTRCPPRFRAVRKRPVGAWGLSQQVPIQRVPQWLSPRT